MKRFCFVFLLMIPPLALCGQVKNKSAADSMAASQTLNELVDALSHLNLEKLTEQFTEDATAFFPPSSKRMQRASNRKEIEMTFGGFFENLKKQNITHLDIHPVDLRIQVLAKTAVASFHLNDPELFGRRTIVLQKIKDRWLIVHLHASGVKPN